MPDLLVTFVMILVLLKLVWQNDATFIQLFVQVYKILHHLVPAGYIMYLLTFRIYSCFLKILHGYVGRNGHL